MKEKTKNYLQNIVKDFNRFAIMEAFDEMLNQSYMLVSALIVLELEGIAKFKIVHDEPFKIYSTIHLEDEEGHKICEERTVKTHEPNGNNKYVSVS